MKPRWIVLSAAVALFLAGCATDSELTQKEKDKMAREQQREAQKQAQAQEKMMREGTQSQQRRGIR
jgi:outer membrane biogenesis lipoprotein LolB